MELYFHVYGEGLLLGIEPSLEAAQNFLLKCFQRGIQIMIKGEIVTGPPIQIFNVYNIVSRNPETGEKLQQWEYVPNFETETLSLK